MNHCLCPIDDQLNFTDHIARTARSCKFALHNIRKNRACYTNPCPSACSIQTGLL